MRWQQKVQQQSQEGGLCRSLGGRRGRRDDAMNQMGKFGLLTMKSPKPKARERYVP